MLELVDALSTFKNKMQTFTKEIVRVGKIQNTGITLEFLDLIGEAVFATCMVDGVKTHLLLTAEKRLPFGDLRETIAENGLAFLYQSCEADKHGEWKYSADLSDDENATKYQIRNEFHQPYTETPLRTGIRNESLQAKLVLYFPSEGKTKDVDGMAVFEMGNNLSENSGLVFYYNFRLILESDVKYL